MTNEEIDIRLKTLSIRLPAHAQSLMNRGTPGIERELELMNMSLMAVWAMLGEIAKRLPDDKSKDTDCVCKK